MNNLILSLLIIFSFYKKASSIIYDVKSLKSLKRSLRLLDDDTSFLHKVKGDSNYLNYYYTTLYLGKDKHPQTYILDTGSAITTSPCDKCQHCGKHFNQKYKLENESKIISCNDKKCSLVRSTCSNKKCSFSISYAEGSKLSGFYVNEEIYFETIDSENNMTSTSYSIPIGCTTLETHLFETQLADGIMGLNNVDNSFINILYNSKVIQKKLFSLCFSQEGGYFSIGNVVTAHHYDKNISYVQLENTSGNYYMRLKDVIIGDNKVVYNGKAFVDSGTTISYFPDFFFEKLIKEFLKSCKDKKCGNLRKLKGLGYCVQINNDNEIDQIIHEGWGNITIVFEGYKFIWTPDNYHFIYKTKANGKNVCIGFDGDRRNNILLGTTFMHGYDIIFDKDKNRVGFAKADCERKIDFNEYNKNINISNQLENKKDKEKISDIVTNIIREENSKITDIIIKNKNITDTDTNKNKGENKTIIDKNTNKNIITDTDKNKIKEKNKEISDINFNKENNKNLSDNINKFDNNNIISDNDNKINEETKKIEDKVKVSQDYRNSSDNKKGNEINRINTKNVQNKEKDKEKNKTLSDIYIKDGVIDIKIDKTKDKVINEKSNNEMNNDSTKGNELKNTKNKEDNDKNIINDNAIIKFFISFTFVILLLFVIFNIILCRENYLSIKNRQSENNLNQFELGVINEDTNSPMSLYNDSTV